MSGTARTWRTCCGWAGRVDYDVVKDLHAAGAVGTYDASVVTKDDAGKVHVNKDEMATRHGAWGGAAVGALVGIIFPPSLVVGGGGGRNRGWGERSSVEGHVPGGRQGVRRPHRRRPGRPGIVVGESKLSKQALDKAGLKAEKQVAKDLGRGPEGYRQGRQPRCPVQPKAARSGAADMGFAM